MLKLIGIILLVGVEDSTVVVEKNDTIQTQSVVFKKEVDSPQLLYKYKHQQGFFCDFEDKINENRKINLNVGVGDQ